MFAPDSTPAPFNTMGELMRSHDSLMSREDDPSNAPEIAHFIRRVMATGRVLAARRTRSDARTILNYWYAKLTRIDREQAQSLRSDSLEEYAGASESAECEEESRARQKVSLMEKAKAFQSSLPAVDAPALRRLQLRLFSLDDHEQPQRGQVPLTDRIFKDAVVENLTDRLIDAGLLKREAVGGSTAADAVVLVNDSLFEDWTSLGTLVKKRKSLRELSRDWEKSDGLGKAFIEKGALLDTAEDFTDLSDSERSFLSASRLKVTKSWRIRMGALVTLLIVLGCFTGTLIWKNVDLAGKEKTLAAERDKITKLNSELTISHDRIKAQLDERSTGEDAEKAELSRRLRIAQGELASLLRMQIDHQEEPDTRRMVPTNIRAERTSSYFQGKSTFSSGRNDPATPKVRFIPQVHTAKLIDEAYMDLPRQMPVTAVLKNPDPIVLLPGTSISTQPSAKIRGSLGLFVQKAGVGEVYLVAPDFILSGQLGDPVYAGEKTPSEVGKISGPWVTEGLAYASINHSALVRANLLGTGQLSRFASVASLREGVAVTLIGSGSGLSCGKIKRIMPDGTVVTERISSPGDAGAPVVLSDGPEKNGLVGLLVSRSADGLESMVMPVEAALSLHGLKLYQPEFSGQDQSLAGAMAEIFVHQTQPAVLVKMRPFIQVLQTAGFIFPVSEAQLKRVVADDTEIRYFHEEDKPIAEKVETMLKEAGFPSKIIVDSIPDDEAPPKFIQISVSKKAFP